MAYRFAAKGCALGLLACLVVAGCSTLLPTEKAATASLASDEAAKTPPDAKPADSAEIKQVAHWVEETVADTVASSPAPNVEEAAPPEDADAATLSVDELVDFALQHHPQLRARKQEIGAAAGKLRQARLLPNPSLVIDSESPLTESDPTTVTSRLMFTIPLTRKRLWAQGVECAEIERARAQLDTDTELILAEVADAALEVAYYQELVGVQDEARQLADREAAAQRQRVDATLLNATAAAAAAAASQLAYYDVTEKLQVARDRLAKAVAWPPGRSISVRGRLQFAEIDCPALPDVLCLVQKRHPSIAGARAVVAQSRQALNLARAEAWPDISIGPRFQADTDRADDRMGGRLALDVPIFDRKQGDIAEAAATLRASGHWLAAARVNTLNDVAAAYHNMTSLRQSLAHYAEKVQPEVERMKTVLERVEQQQGIEAYAAIEARQRLLKLRLDHLDRLQRYSRLLVRLELLVGEPLAQSPLVL